MTRRSFFFSYCLSFVTCDLEYCAYFYAEDFNQMAGGYTPRPDWDGIEKELLEKGIDLPPPPIPNVHFDAEDEFEEPLLEEIEFVHLFSIQIKLLSLRFADLRVVEFHGIVYRSQTGADAAKIAIGSSPTGATEPSTAKSSKRVLSAMAQRKKNIRKQRYWLMKLLGRSVSTSFLFSRHISHTSH